MTGGPVFALRQGHVHASPAPHACHSRRARPVVAVPIRKPPHHDGDTTQRIHEKSNTSRGRNTCRITRDRAAQIAADTPLRKAFDHPAQSHATRRSRHSRQARRARRGSFAQAYVSGRVGRLPLSRRARSENFPRRLAKDREHRGSPDTRSTFRPPRFPSPGRVEDTPPGVSEWRSIALCRARSHGNKGGIRAENAPTKLPERALKPTRCEEWRRAGFRFLPEPGSQGGRTDTVPLRKESDIPHTSRGSPR